MCLLNQIKEGDYLHIGRVGRDRLAGLSIFCGYPCNHCLVAAGRGFYQNYREDAAFGSHEPATDVFASQGVWEVWVGELAEQLFCLVVISLCGPDLASKEAQVLIFFVLCDYCPPFFILGVERDTLERRTSSPVAPAVCHVLRAGAEAEVAPSIVQAVVVFMVDLKAVGRMHDLPVHLNGCSSFFDCHVSYGIERVRTFAAFLGAPFELRKPIIVLRVHERNFSVR